MSSNDTLEAEESVALDTNVSSSPGSPPLVQVKVQRVAVSEDEYPAQPTFFYFAIKFLLGALTLIVLVIAYWFQPSSCEGICQVAATENNSVCGPMAPKSLVVHSLPFSLGEGFQTVFKEAQKKKGFNWISAMNLSLPSDASLDAQFQMLNELEERITNIPWWQVTRGNHSLFETDVGAVDWSKLNKVKDVIVSIAFVRNPRERLYDAFQHWKASLPVSFLQGILDTTTSDLDFESCVSDPFCRKRLRLQSMCEQQARFLCGSDCFEDNLGVNEIVTRVKSNIRTKFALVGFVEDAAATASLLRRHFPTYFEFIPSEFNIYKEQRHSYSPKVNAILDEICALDDYAYAEVVERLKEKGQQCGVSVTEPNTLRHIPKGGFHLLNIF